jgi:non-specific serine/threonine protein kinase
MIPVTPLPSDVEPERLPGGTGVGSFMLQTMQSRDEFSIRYRATGSASVGEVVIEEYAPAGISLRDAAGQLGPRSAAHAALWEAGLQAYLRESELLTRPLHPALVRIAAVWQVRGTVYRLWPRIEGRRLAEVCSAWTEPPTEYWLRSFMAPLLDALESLHQAGWVHGSVRPGQILVQPDGGPLLLDTAAVRTAIGARMPQPSPWPEPGFRPPELAEPPSGYASGPWSDLYSLAAVARFCMGAPRTTDDLAQQPRGLSIGRYSEDFVASFERALAIDPRQRPQSVAMFRLQLRSAGVTQSPRQPQDRLALSDIPLRTVPLEGEAVPRPVSAPVEPEAGTDRSGPRSEPMFGGLPQARRRVQAPRARGWPWAAAAALGALVIAAVVMYQRIGGQERPRAGTTPGVSAVDPLPEREAAASGGIAATMPDPAPTPPQTPVVQTPTPPPERATVSPEPPVLPTVAAVQPGRPASATARAATDSPTRDAGAIGRQAVVDTPAAACAPRTNFALYRCMQSQCELSRYYAHPQCVRLRRFDELPS